MVINVYGEEIDVGRYLLGRKSGRILRVGIVYPDQPNGD
jgi:hypothetical protein